MNNEALNNASQKMVALTLAAVMAKEKLNEAGAGTVEELPGTLSKALSSERERNDGFLLEYFEPLGVSFSKDGRVMFPTGGLAGIDIGSLHREIYNELLKFMRAAHKNGIPDMPINELLEYGWITHFETYGDFYGGVLVIVPVTVGVELMSMTLVENGVTSPEPTYMPTTRAMARVLEELVANQRPELWAKFLVEQRAHMLHIR